MMNYIFGKITQTQICRIKKIRFWLVSVEKSKNKVRREKLIPMREKMIEFHKIILIYASRLKFILIRLKIIKKTCNLTQHCARNDPINRRIKTFHFAFWKTTIQRSSYEFFHLIWWNIDFKHSLDAELSLKEDQNKRFKDFVVWKVRLIKKNPRMQTLLKRGYK